MNWITFHLHVQKENTNKRILGIEDVIGEEILLLERVMNQKGLVGRIEGQDVVIKSNFLEKKTDLRDENNLVILIEVVEDFQRKVKMENEINMEIRKNHTLEIGILEEGRPETEAGVVEINMVTNLLETEVAVVEATVTDPLEEEVAEVESMVTTLLEEEAAEVEVITEIIPLEIEEVEVEINMVTNLLEIEEAEVKAMVIDPLETVVEVAETSTVTNPLEEEVAEVEVITEIEAGEEIMEVVNPAINLTQVKNSMMERRTLGKNENLRTRVIETTNVKIPLETKISLF